jgi:YfiH family protein
LEPLAEHFFTTRAWRLGGRTQDSSEGWTEVASTASVTPGCLVRLIQVHGADVVVYREDKRPADGPAPRADVVLTDNPALALTVQTADCVPILLADRRTRAVAAAHAGWRGLAARVPRVVVDRMIADFGSKVDDLMVAIGPSIGACCYEVGEDVRGRFEGERFTPADIARWFQTAPAISSTNPPMASLPPHRRPNHWFFDGWTCAREQLMSAGVPADQIFGADLCTASHERCFCSYRRDGVVAGRMAALIRPSPSPR